MAKQLFPVGVWVYAKRPYEKARKGKVVRALNAQRSYLRRIDFGGTCELFSVDDLRGTDMAVDEFLSGLWEKLRQESINAPSYVKVKNRINNMLIAEGDQNGSL